MKTRAILPLLRSSAARKATLRSLEALRVETVV